MLLFISFSISCDDSLILFKKGMVLLDATCMLQIAIGESLKNLDKTTDGKLLHPMGLH